MASGGSTVAVDRMHQHARFLREWLATVQGKHGDRVPDAVVERVRAELGCSQIPRHRQLLTSRDVLLALKKLRMALHYEDVPEITRRLRALDEEGGGFFAVAAPLDLPEEVEEALISGYVEVRRALMRRSPPATLSPVFIVRKLLEAGGPANDAYLAHFPHFRSEAQRAMQERVWKTVSLGGAGVACPQGAGPPADPEQKLDQNTGGFPDCGGGI